MLRTVFSNKSSVKTIASRFLGPVNVQRNESTTAVSKSKDSSPMSCEEYRKHIEELMKKELPKPYDGPERDLVNFPKRVRPVEPGKIRMGFLPEEWFQFFYKKTGVTGPYVFGTGLLTFLLSKEWFVIEHEFSTGVAMFMLVYIAVKKFGPGLKAHQLKQVEEDEKFYNDQRDKAIKDLENNINDQKKNLWQFEGQKILMEAKRENIKMQLETEYRRRLMNVYEQVKKRLDYQMEMYNTKRKLEQKHMVDWIVSNVIKSITPQQEKEALQKCIEDLKVLSTQAR